MLTNLKLKVIDNLIWVILILLVIANAFITPRFFSAHNLTNIMYHSVVLGFLIIAESLCLMTGNFDLSIESTIAFAPAIGVLLMTSWLPGFNPIATILIILAIGALIGFFNGVMISYLGINPFLQTLSFLIILRGLTYKLIPMSIFQLPDSFIFLGSKKLAFNIPLAVFVMIAGFIIVHFILSYTKFGRNVLAIGGNERASFISGINTKKVKTIVFMISGCIAAFAGVMAIGRQQSITNKMGDGLVFMAFAGAVMGGVGLNGGTGSALGMLGGVLVLGVIDNSLTLLGVDAFMVYATKGILIFIAIVLDNSKIRLRENLILKEEKKKLGHAIELKT
jgi:simple sugar transport system permease protein/ribose transport system permease protein